MSGAPSASSTAATRVPIPSIANRTRAPRTSSRTARSAATSWLGVYRKSSERKGGSDMQKCPHRTVPDELTLRPVRDPGVSASVPCLPPSPVPSDQGTANPTVAACEASSGTGVLVTLLHAAPARPARSIVVRAAAAARGHRLGDLVAGRGDEEEALDALTGGVAGRRVARERVEQVAVVGHLVRPVGLLRGPEEARVDAGAAGGRPAGRERRPGRDARTGAGARLPRILFEEVERVALCVHEDRAVLGGVRDLDGRAGRGGRGGAARGRWGGRGAVRARDQRERGREGKQGHA